MQISAGTFHARDLVTALKAAGEPTRLRILLLLAGNELTVKDLTQILGQSQPRISRHLKLLAEAGLLERFQDGSWAYFHVSDRSEGGRLTRRLLEAVDTHDPAIGRDRQRAEALKRDRETAAQAYFRDHAEEWDRIRALHASQEKVEAAMLAALGPGPFRFLVDLGTGTGRMLELFSPRFQRGLGLDVNQSMLAYARGKISASGLANAEVRHGDLYDLALGPGVADAVVMHQVLHYLSEPAIAIREAARVLAPGGRLLIVDFAPHEVEELREVHAHERLGISDQQMSQWLADAGLVTLMSEKLDPAPGDRGTEKLIVSLWLAGRPKAFAADSHTPRKLERSPS